MKASYATLGAYADNTVCSIAHDLSIRENYEKDRIFPFTPFRAEYYGPMIPSYPSMDSSTRVVYFVQK